MTIQGFFQVSPESDSLHHDEMITITATIINTTPEIIYLIFISDDNSAFRNSPIMAHPKRAEHA
jgi:hypothetical protein